MAYNCIDGWNDIIEELDLPIPNDDDRWDDAADVAGVACERIRSMQKAEVVARTMLRALLTAEAALRDISTLNREQEIDLAAITDATLVALAAGIKPE